MGSTSLSHNNETATIVDSIKIGFEGGGIDEMSQFQVIGTDSFALEPDSSHQLTIRYFPHLNELYTEDLAGINANVWFYNQSEVNEPIFNGISLSANSIVNLSASPAEQVFSDVPVGAFVEQDYTYTNTTGTIQEMTDILIGHFNYADSSFVELSEFTVVNETQFDLNPGESQTITLRYSPQDVGSDSAYVYAFSPNYISHIMPISGSSILPTVTIEPDTLDFGSVQVGAFEEFELSVTPDFITGEIDVVDVNTTSAVFTIVSDTAFTILPEENIPVTIRFSPGVEDSTYTGNLEIISSVGDTTIMLASSFLSGSGSGSNASNFNLISPTNGPSGFPVHTNFTWQNAFGGSTGNYLLRYGTDLEDIMAGIPGTYLEIEGIADENYYVEVDLPAGSLIYWHVWAVNPDGSMVEADLNNLGYFSVQTSNPVLNGPIPGPRTLLPENSPYLVTGDVRILENNHLIIPAGVEIRFEYEDEYFEILVEGELRALGTAEAPVIFHSDASSSPGMWKGIRWTNTANNLILNPDSTISAGSYLSHTIISDGGSDGQPVLDCYYDGRSITKSLLIEDSEISGNAGPGIRFGHLSVLQNSTVADNGGYGVDGGLVFRTNIISGNSGYGINTPDGEVFVSNEILDNNGAAIVSGKGDLFQDNIVSGNSGNGIQTDLGYTFDNNLIENNGGYGIYAGLGESFTDNTISGNGSYGIKTEAGNLFENNLVSDNDGFGVETTTAYSSGTITFTNNTVSGNTGGNGDWDGGILTSILAEFTENLIAGNTGYGITGGYSFSADSVVNNTSFGIYSDGGNYFNTITVNDNGSYGIHTEAGDSFDGNTVNGNGSYGIYTAAGNTFSNNEVSLNDGYGIYSEAGDSFDSNTVNGNGGYGINTDSGESFSGNIITENNGYGIDTDSGNTFESNTVSDNGSWGINTDTGYSFSDNTVENNGGFGINTDTGQLFSGNVITGNNGYGLNTDAGLEFSDNTISSNGDYGLNTDSGHSFSGNTISSNGTYGLNISPGDSLITLSENQFESNGSNGLQAVITTSITLENNTFTTNGDNGIDIDSASEILISALTLHGDNSQDFGNATPDGNNENGILITNSGTFTITGSTIADNWATGLFIESTDSLTIQNNTFSGNGWSGLRQINGVHSLVENNTFTGNSNSTHNSSNTGGAIYSDMPEVSIISNEITQNISTYGGGVYIQSGSPFLYDNLISYNRSHQSGGGIFVSGGADNSPNVVFNTITGDTSLTDMGGAIFIDNTGNNRTSINKNVISEWVGHGIYGDPDSLMYNNILISTINGGEIGYNLIKTNDEDMIGTAEYNWWGTTAVDDINSYIFDGIDDGTLGYVQIVANLGYPSPDAPGQVNDAISISLYRDETYSQILDYPPGVGSILWIELEAVDGNPNSVDATPITVQNLSAFGTFPVLVQETSENSAIFRGNIPTAEESNLFEGIIGASPGDTIQIYSAVDPEVELFVTMGGPADGEISETELNFELGPHDSTGSNIVLTNIGSGFMNAELSTDKDWLTLSVDHIELLPDSSTVFELFVNTSGVENGDHLGLVQVAYDDQIDSITVSLAVQNLIYADDQFVESGTVTSIPLYIDLNDGQELSGLVFAVEVAPIVGPEIDQSMDIELILPGSDPLISEFEPNYFSAAISSFDESLTGLGIHFANLLLTLPGSANNTDTYELYITGASGSDENYNLVELVSFEDALLTVFMTNEKPIFSSSFNDQALVEGDSNEIDFEVTDPEGTDVAVVLLDAPEYVSIDHNPGDPAGTININTMIGDNSGMVILEASDSGIPSASTIDSFYVAINHYPSWDAPSGLEILEGDTLVLPITGSDIDGDNVSFELDTGSSADYADWDGSELSLTTQLGSPDGLVIFTISDDGNPPASKQDTILVDILHAPDLLALEDKEIDEDDTLFYPISVSDADGDSLLFSLNSDNDSISVSMNGFTLLAVPASNYFGSAEITVSVSDGSYEVIDSFILDVISINDAPVAEDGSFIIDEDSPVTFDLNAHDIDSDELLYSIIQDPQNGSFESSDSGYVYTPFSNYNGLDSLLFEVSDGNLADSARIEFTILSINDSPLIEGLGLDFHVIENQTLMDTVLFTDPDGDSLSYIINAPDFCQVDVLDDNQGLALTFNAVDSSASEIITISLSDYEFTAIDSAQILIYKTYFVGDVRPHFIDNNNDGDIEDSGEFGDDIVLAPDVINGLKIATGAPETEIPSNGSSLFDALDAAPIDLDANSDGDYFDENERGGDGFIEAADIIVSLKRATLIPGFENVRRVDNSYPFSTQIEGALASNNRDEGIDTLFIGHVNALENDLVELPVYLNRGAGALLDGVIIGFELINSNASIPVTIPLEFVSEVEGNLLAENSGNNFLSLLMMDLNIEPDTQTLIGNIRVEIPEGVVEGDVYTLSARTVSGSTPQYDVININEEQSGSIYIESTFAMQHYEMLYGNNLVSFPGMLEHENAIDFIRLVSAGEDSVNFIISDGVGLFNQCNINDLSLEECMAIGLCANGTCWSGNINAFEANKGYWINVVGSQSWDIAFPTGFAPECNDYNLKWGNNLISYSGYNDTDVKEGLGGENSLAEYFNFIITFNAGLFNNNGIEPFGWSGNLTHLDKKKGYWINVNSTYPTFQDYSNIPFRWNIGYGCESPSGESLSRTIEDPYSEIPDPFRFIQSTEQAFYLLNEINIDGDGPNMGDIILAYNNDVLVGSSIWNGKGTFVPVMGRDISPQTEGFCEVGDIPQFKLLTAHNLQLETLVTIESTTPGWSSLGVYTLESLSAKTVEIPTEFVLHPAYPNPFNPVTTLSFGVPAPSPVEERVGEAGVRSENRDVSLTIYDITGKRVKTLLNKPMAPGPHSIQWNAKGQPSGVYFVKLTAGEIIQTQKLMLLK